MLNQINNLSQIAYVRRYELFDGKERGLRIIEVDNGVLRFLLNESKALDMSQLWHKGINISFVCKNGLVSREIAYASRFEGGMLYTCGLDNIGARDGYEIHGLLHNTPARILSCVCDEEKIEVVGEIELSALFGQNLYIKRTVSTKIGSSSVSVRDELTNKGTKTENYCLLYHCNVGYPMLDAGVTVEQDARTVIPRTKHAADHIADRTTFPAPVDNEEESCYYIENNVPEITVTNKKLSKKFVLSYTGDTLPCQVQWVTNASHDYALGIEPSTSFMDGYFKYKTIAPNQKIVFGVTFDVKDI